MKFSELSVGMAFEYTTTVSSQMVEDFAKVSGDHNPIHLDEDYAAKSMFGGRIIHGMIIGALFSRTVATDFPGPGSIYLGQTLSFKRPVYHNDTVVIKVEVLQLRPEKNILTLSTRCLVNGKLAVDGEATVKLLEDV